MSDFLIDVISVGAILGFVLAIGLIFSDNVKNFLSNMLR